MPARLFVLRCIIKGCHEVKRGREREKRKRNTHTHTHTQRERERMVTVIY